ncbi:unnamed protein product [Rotaria sp. Silwood1]|nr:unnamed protein product [Rotaria sp. Silwood1]CAF1257622.1 unnamed protein product [Rotaria sp. Silwood1]
MNTCKLWEGAIKRTDAQSSITRENFRFQQSTIDEIVKLAHNKYDGHTARCSPAQHSYSLAFCQYINDDDLFNCTMLEAKLTHYSPIAGQTVLNVVLHYVSISDNTAQANAKAFSEEKVLIC